MPKKITVKYLIKHHKILAFVGLIICGIIATLQFNNIQVGIITDYGADFFTPIIIYYWAKVYNRFFIKLPKKPSNIIISVGLLTFCILWELRQFYSPDYGTFDIVDIPVYGIAVFLCFLIDYKVEKMTIITAQNKSTG